MGTDAAVRVTDLLSGDGPEFIPPPTPYSYWGWGMRPPLRDEPAEITASEPERTVLTPLLP